MRGRADGHKVRVNDRLLLRSVSGRLLRFIARMWNQENLVSLVRDNPKTQQSQFYLNVLSVSLKFPVALSNFYHH